MTVPPEDTPEADAPDMGPHGRPLLGGSEVAAEETLANLLEQEAVQEQAERLRSLEAAGEEPDPELATAVSRGAGLTALATLVTEGTTLVQFFVLPVFLRPAQLGLFALASGLALLMVQFRDFSLGMKLVQDKEYSREHAFNVAFTMELVLGVGGAVLIAATSPLLGAAFHNGELTRLVLALTPMAFAPLLSLPDFLLVRDMRFGTRLVINSVANLLGLTAAIGGAAVLNMGPFCIVAGQLTTMAALGLMLYPTARIRPKLVWDRGATRTFVGFGWPLWLASILQAVFYQGAISTVSAMLSFAVAGFFYRVWGFVNLSYRLNVQATIALYAAVCRVGEDRDRLRRAHVATNRIMMLWAAPLCMLLVFFAPDLVLVWSAGWHRAAPFFQAVGVFFVFGTLGFDWEIYYRARGNTKPFFILALYLLASLPVFILMVWAWGDSGVIAWILVISVAVFLVRTVYATKLLGWTNLFVGCWRELAGAAVSAAAGYGVRTLLGGGLGPALAGMVVMGLLYLASLGVLNRRLLGFLADALRGRPTGGLTALLNAEDGGSADS